MLLKKIIIFAAMLFTVFLIALDFVQAQIKPANSLYAEPARLMLPGDENEEEEFERGNLLREAIYPIGWSKDGKFAFVSEPADEACGCYFADFIIQDLRTDKVLWKNHFEGTEEGKENLQTYWKKNQKLFSRQLTQYGIRWQKSFALQKSELVYKGDIFSLKIQNKTTVDEDRKVSGSIRLQLISKQKGVKTIYEKNYDPKNYDSFMDAELAGGLISPFEPRAVVILVETHRGWEGPPHVTEIIIVGATLTTGFR